MDATITTCEDWQANPSAIPKFSQKGIREIALKDDYEFFRIIRVQTEVDAPTGVPARCVTSHVRILGDRRKIMKLDQLYELFDQAIALPTSAEQEDFIHQHCREDTGLRQELLNLLQAHRQGNFLLDNPTEVMDSSAIVPTESEGQSIGNYKLLQKIGEGGMGIVFMAEQQKPIRRTVALKIIREGMNSKQIIARFEAEREALSRLDHPNATRILDAGVTQLGRPYFVMDLVRGTHIVRYCNTHRMPIAQRLELMEKVCMVIHHAHQKGILHRDIKPSNVMITQHDGVPVPKVIDFGIAKALDRPLTEQTLFTRYGDLVGTPEYMSPEQAEMSGLDLDSRTDIYSLGVLLYELLTGSTPITTAQIQGRGLLKIFETIRDSEAELPSMRVTRTMSMEDTLADERLSTPSLLRKSLVGDLDWITMKALAKDRNERYESAAAMAKDIRNYLQGEAVEAAAPTLVYRLRKFYRKHRSISILAAASTILLLASTALSVYWAITSAHNAWIASNQSQQLGEQKQALEAALGRALRAEKQAETLAREEGRRATEANARSAMIESVATSYGDKLKVMLQGLDNSKVQSLREISVPLSAKASNPRPEGEMLAASPPAPESTWMAEVQAIISEAIPGSPIRSSWSKTTNNDRVVISPNVLGSISSEVILQFGDTTENQLLYWDFLLEEQRKRFGSKDVFVAETLYRRARCRVEPSKPTIKRISMPNADGSPMESLQVFTKDTGKEIGEDKLPSPAEWLAAENDLREAFTIVKDRSDAQLLQLEIMTLLSQSLSNQGKRTQTEEFVQRAMEILQQLDKLELSASDATRVNSAKLRLEKETVKTKHSAPK